MYILRWNWKNNWKRNNAHNVHMEKLKVMALNGKFCGPAKKINPKKIMQYITSYMKTSKKYLKKTCFKNKKEL
jgi:hypothetical protein